MHFNLPQSVSTTAGTGLMLQKSFEYTESGGFPEYLIHQRRELLEQLAESLGSEVHPQERNALDSLRDFFGG